MSGVRGAFEEHVNGFDISSSVPEIYPEECNTYSTSASISGIIVFQVWFANINQIQKA